MAKEVFSPDTAYATSPNIVHPLGQAASDLADARAQLEIADRLGSRAAGGGSSQPPTIATTKAGLGAPTNGKVGIIRLGTYPDVREVEFVGDGTRWIATREHVMISQADAWGMDLSNRSLASFRNAYVRFYSGLPYGKAMSFLSTSYTAGSATMNVNNAAAFAASGTVKLRDQTITYTGKTANTLTGCSGGAGTFPIDVTQVIQGEIGGWGTEVVPLDRVGEMYAAGFTLEEKANAYLNGSADLVSMTVKPYYFNYDPADDITMPPDAPSGGLGLGVGLTGPATPGGASNRAVERNFTYTQSAWTAFAATAPSKRYLIAALYGQMNSAGANDNGEVYGYALRLRWVG